MIKLEVGKFYRDGDNRKVKIVYEKDGRYIGIDSGNSIIEIAYIYRQSGAMIDSGEPRFDDIVEEWQEPDCHL